MAIPQLKRINWWFKYNKSIMFQRTSLVILSATTDIKFIVEQDKLGCVKTAISTFTRSCKSHSDLRIAKDCFSYDFNCLSEVRMHYIDT
jgi:hypothetical protein